MSQSLPSRIQLKVVTPVKMLVETEADEIELPGLDGYLGILPGHRSLNTALGDGEIIYRSGSREERYSVHGGYAEITPESVLVITEMKEEGNGQSTEERG